MDEQAGLLLRSLAADVVAHPCCARCKRNAAEALRLLGEGPGPTSHQPAGDEFEFTVSVRLPGAHPDDVAAMHGTLDAAARAAGAADVFVAPRPRR